MPVLADLTEEECYLLAILKDPSGIDQAEFCWVDETSPDSCFRCYDYQYPWYRNMSKFQIDQCARAIGKSVGMTMRAWAFPFCNAGKELLLTAPEYIHLDPVTKNVEERILASRLSREFLKESKTSNGITHRPFRALFRNNASINGRIPQKDGKGVKGQHPNELEMDEAQDYPKPGWIELTETLRYGDPDSKWRAHGVTRGVRDAYFERTQPESGWHVHRYTAMHRPDWTPAEREAKAIDYGGRHSPDFKRNILGEHGDEASVLFVLSRLMMCVDSKKDSKYNTEEYYFVSITEEKLRNTGFSVDSFLDFPSLHTSVYKRFWVGMDVGMTNHPSEILIFAETTKGGNFCLKLVARIHLERISSRNQRKVLEAIYEFYKPQAISMDRTGLGLPIFQEIMEDPDTPPGMPDVMRPYNFSEKIVIGYEVEDEDAPYDPDEPFGKEIKANVLEYSSDMLRSKVDVEGILLPWDLDLVKEFQGQTYVVQKSTQNPYGKKVFNQGKFHALDGARMAVLGQLQEEIEQNREVAGNTEPVLDTFLAIA